MPVKNLIHKTGITRFNNDRVSEVTDEIVDEPILKINIDGRDMFEMVFSPTHAIKLAAGFLFTQSIIEKKEDILDIRLDTSQNRCTVKLGITAKKRLERFQQLRQVKGSSGGVLLQGTQKESGQPAPLESTPLLSANQVLKLMKLHFDHSFLFRKTGAVHSSGLCRPDQIIHYFEDIGRHNALDKLAGKILLDEIDTTALIATLSCRMSLEIIGKIIKTGIGVVISNAAPTLSAVRLAQHKGLTVIGFARGQRFNIYTHRNRIIMP